MVNHVNTCDVSAIKTSAPIGNPLTKTCNDDNGQGYCLHTEPSGHSQPAQNGVQGRH